MTIGDPAAWSGLFPDHFIPDILDLVHSSWSTFQKPHSDELEVTITRRFKHDLRLAKNISLLPFRIERELPEDDPQSGAELGRVDLKFIPTGSALEEVYFAFECKRLYALVNGEWDALTSQYVTEGVTRYVTGQYAARMRHGGMIGYVLNGNVARAKEQVEKNLTAKCQSLRMTAPGRFGPSSLRPTNDDIRETVHHLDHGRNFLLHHVFLGSPATGPAPVPPTPAKSVVAAKPRRSKK